MRRYGASWGPAKASQIMIGTLLLFPGHRFWFAPFPPGFRGMPGHRFWFAPFPPGFRGMPGHRFWFAPFPQPQSEDDRIATSGPYGAPMGANGDPRRAPVGAPYGPYTAIRSPMSRCRCRQAPYGPHTAIRSPMSRCKAPRRGPIRTLYGDPVPNVTIARAYLPESTLLMIYHIGPPASPIWNV
jgi:hypothetical protein